MHGSAIRTEAGTLLRPSKVTSSHRKGQQHIGGSHIDFLCRKTSDQVDFGGLYEPGRNRSPRKQRMLAACATVCGPGLRPVDYLDRMKHLPPSSLLDSG